MTQQHCTSRALSFVYKICACELGQSHPNCQTEQKETSAGWKNKIQGRRCKEVRREGLSVPYLWSREHCTPVWQTHLEKRREGREQAVRAPRRPWQRDGCQREEGQEGRGCQKGGGHKQVRTCLKATDPSYVALCKRDTSPGSWTKRPPNLVPTQQHGHSV